MGHPSSILMCGMKVHIVAPWMCAQHTLKIIKQAPFVGLFNDLMVSPSLCCEDVLVLPT